MRVHLLSDGQIQRLHEASLRILATLGVQVPHEQMLRLLAEAGADQGSSLVMLVMQHEIISYVERLLGELDVSEETLGLEVLARAKDSGSFLAEEHTVRHFRRELWFPQLLDRRFFQSWADDERKDMAARCRETKDRILREHTPALLGVDVRNAIDQLVNDARRHLA